MKFWLVFLSCLPLISAVDAQTPASKDPANCTVQGQIIQAPGGLPIRKAGIRLFSSGGEEEDSTEYAAVTDAEGRFKIENVKPGTYRLYFGRDGFVAADKGHHGWGMLLSLEPAQEVKDLLFHLTPAAVITGRVRDDDGDPVRNANVLAIPYRAVSHGADRRRPLHNADQCSTNDLGECRISGLAPGRYLVAAQPEFRAGPLIKNGTDKNAQVCTTTYYPGETEKKLAAPLELRAGDEVPVKVTLRSVHTFHVRGQVINLPAWTSKEEAELMLQPQDEENEIYLPTGDLDKDGAFDIKGVAPGSYSILVAPTTVRGFFAVPDAGTPQMMRGDQTVQVTDADVDGLRIAALANGRVRGQLRMDNGQKTDWSQAVMELQADHGTPTGIAATGGAYAEVKGDGSFETVALAGVYHLQFSHMSKVPQDYFVKAVNLGGKNVADSGFTVGGGTYSLDVVVSANGATVEGVAADDKDKPASDVQVICIPDANRRERRDLYRLVTTDPRGRFSLQGLNPGEYLVFALDADVDEAEIADPEFVGTHESLGQAVKLEEGEHKVIRLKLAVSSD